MPSGGPTRRSGAPSRPGSNWDRLEATRALGMSRLLSRQPDLAAEALRWVWAHTENEGVNDRGAFPAAPELVEALVDLGELDEATAVAERLAELAEAQDHPWGIATAQRCHAVDPPRVRRTTTSRCRSSTRSRRRVREPRSPVRGGPVAARARPRPAPAPEVGGGARHVGARGRRLRPRSGRTGWAEAGPRRALARRSAPHRPMPASSRLAERRVAELAAQGLANKEIAQALVVTVSTVEFHLSKTYAKLGIRSRAQLAAGSRRAHRRGRALVPALGFG